MMVYLLGGFVKVLMGFNLILLIRFVGVVRVVDFLNFDIYVLDLWW